MRAYTPICAPGALGHFTLALKVYRANVHPEHPLGGRMSQYLDHLQVRGEGGAQARLACGCVPLPAPQPTAWGFPAGCSLGRWDRSAHQSPLMFVALPLPPQVGDYMFAKLAPYDFAYLGQGVFQARAGRGGGFTPEGFR